MKFVTVKRTASKLSKAIIILGIYINTSSQFIYTGNCGYGDAVFLFKKHITMKKLIFSFIVVATAILVSCNEEFEELTSDYTPNYRDGVYSGDNLTFTVDGEPRTVNSVTISSRQVGNDTLYSDNLKKHYLSPIYVTNVIIKGFRSINIQRD